jgi:hypothetical protein
MPSRANVPRRSSFLTAGRFPAVGTLGRALLTAVVFSLGCRNVPLLKPLDLSEPGWTLRQGQALWIPRDGAGELAGELLIATHPNGGGFVQFSKTPLPLVVAQITSNTWRIQFVAENQTFSGRGQPPTRFLWLHLAPCLLGRPAVKPVRYQNESGGALSLTNLVTGESIRGVLQVSDESRSRNPSEGSRPGVGAPSGGPVRSFGKVRTSSGEQTWNQAGATAERISRR